MHPPRVTRLRKPPVHPCTSFVSWLPLRPDLHLVIEQKRPVPTRDHCPYIYFARLMILISPVTAQDILRRPVAPEISFNRISDAPNFYSPATPSASMESSFNRFMAFSSRYIPLNVAIVVRMLKRPWSPVWMCMDPDTEGKRYDLHNGDKS
ncbi:uncharacterized protein BT62DRAFT_1071816 [Guyanagaster necrorhizus]|uniref:Uncharacterized protein n=1 Tax=Guyanagaster necrorhizus TaxID=856835 RepID=A0A9P7W235_9AGAR|nr:uncharacterized protein BT62DRAFT_1071816 [Guyanagaster necrorhizus MCA 3950]KAG7451232.1 hypothetical protein BT62DRAFT_1071816 [Guyanagaster necrorhizus MCA 3950]